MKKNDKIKEEKSRITKIAENVKKVSAKTGGFSKYVKDTVINKMLESETSDLDNFIANDEILNKIFPEPKAAKTSQIKKEALPIRDILSRKTSALSKMANSSAAKPNEFEGELNDLSQYMGDRLSKVGFKAVKSHYESIFTNEDYVGKAVEHGQYSSKLVIDNVLDKLTTIRDSINTENLNEEDLGIAQEKAQLLDDKIDELKNHPERDVEGQKEKIMGSLREQRMSTLEKKAVNKFSTFEYLTKEGEKELSPINAESTKTSDLVFGRTNAEYLKQGYAAKMREHLNF